jgi:hypothetical protein
MMLKETIWPKLVVLTHKNGEWWKKDDKIFFRLHIIRINLACQVNYGGPQMM